MIIKHDTLPARDIAVRMLVLAFDKSIPVGMGILQFNADTKLVDSDIVQSILQQENEGCGAISADYAQGRMMKLYIEYGPTGVEARWDDPLRADYQSWCLDYPTYRDLYNAAVASLLAEQEDAANDTN